MKFKISVYYVYYLVNYLIRRVEVRVVEGLNVLTVLDVIKS